jgi:hypothetical protein
MSKPPSRFRPRTAPVECVHDHGRWTSGGERDVVAWAASFARAPGLFDGDGRWGRLIRVFSRQGVPDP